MQSTLAVGFGKGRVGQGRAGEGYLGGRFGLKLEMCIRVGLLEVGWDGVGRFGL